MKVPMGPPPPKNPNPRPDADPIPSDTPHHAGGEAPILSPDAASAAASTPEPLDEMPSETTPGPNPSSSVSPAAAQHERLAIPYTIPPWSEPPGHPFFLEVLKDGAIIEQIDVSMAPPFLFPSDLVDLEDVPDDSRISVASPVDISLLRPGDLEDLVKGVAFDLSDKELFCVEDQDVFDRIYSLVKGFRSLSPGSKFNLVETLRSNLSVLLPNIDSLSRAPTADAADASDSLSSRVASHRNALKIYTFFLLTVAVAEQSAADSAPAAPSKPARGLAKATASTWNWESHRSRVLGLIANSLEMNLSLLFGSTADDNYLSFVSRCVFGLCENSVLMRDADTRSGLARIIGAVSTKHHQVAQLCGPILRLIHKFDFAAPHIAEFAAMAEKKYCDGSLAMALIREIGRADPKDYVRDTTGAENVGRFLVELADQSPKLMTANVGVLVPHFGGESYKIRNALVGVLGKLVAKAFKDVEGDASSKNLRLRGKQAMLEILMERCRDVSAYTRSRVLQSVS